MPEEREKYEAQAKVTYEEQKAKIMKEGGLAPDDEEGWVSLMLKGKAFTFEEFFRAYIKKLRQTDNWSLKPDGEEVE